MSDLSRSKSGQNVKSDFFRQEQKIWDRLSTAVFILDRQGEVYFVNSSARELFQGSYEWLLGRQLQHILKWDETAQRFLSFLQGPSAASCSGILHLHLPNQTEKTSVYGQLTRWEDISLNAHVNAQSDKVDWSKNLPVDPLDDVDTDLFCLECTNISHYEQFKQDEFWHHQADQHHVVIRQLAHEIKNPLGGVRGAAQLLGEELQEVAPDLVEYTDMVLAQVDRLRSLVDRFLLPYREGHDQFVLTNIHELVEGVLPLVQLEFGTDVDWTRDYDISLPEIKLYPDLITQLVLNVIQNAAQAVLQGCHGKPSVKVKTRIARHCIINQKYHKMVMDLMVIDNGLGIPAHVLETMFLPFVTFREGGTGLGLSIAQQIVRQHQGMLDVQSNEQGTTMHILLPME